MIDSNLIASVHQFLRPLIGTIPEILIGAERQEHVLGLIKNLEMEQRRQLKQLFDSFLLTMLAKEASDIDIGGYGCRGHIWYRIHGEKTPEPNLGQYTEDEMDFIILNILTPQQGQNLVAQRNVDFPYNLRVEGRLQRFRSLFRS